MISRVSSHKTKRIAIKCIIKWKGSDYDSARAEIVDPTLKLAPKVGFAPLWEETTSKSHRGVNKVIPFSNGMKRIIKWDLPFNVQEFVSSRAYAWAISGRLWPPLDFLNHEWVQL